MGLRRVVRRPRVSELIIALLAASICDLAAAQTTQTWLDPQSPRAVLLARASAIRDGDAPAIRSLLWAQDPLEERLASAMAAMAQAMAEVRQEAVRSVGREGARDLFGDAEAGWQKQQQSLRDATERIDGDRAAVRMPDGQIVELREIDGRWRIPVQSLLGERPDPQRLEAVLAEISFEQGALSDLKRELSNHKYKSGEAARLSMHRKMAKRLADQTRQKKQTPATAQVTPVSAPPATKP